MKHARKSGGVSLIELLIVISLVLFLGTLAGPFYSNMILRNRLDVTHDMVVGVIRKAQLYAMDGRNNQTWGVCLTGGKIRLFAGSCAAPIIKEDYTPPTSVTVSGITSITFSPLRAEPSAPFVVLMQTNLKSSAVSINQAGGMDVN